MKKKLLSGILAASMVFGGEFASALPSLGIVAAAEMVKDGLKCEIVDNSYITITGLDSSDMTEIVIPEKIGSYPVKAIKDLAFYNNKTITSVTISEGVATIGENAFNGCSNLAALSLPDSLTTIKTYAFSGCAINSLTLPQNLTSMGNAAFWDCDNITTVTIPGSLEQLNEQTFASCGALETVIISEGVTKICRNAFGGSVKLKTVTIPDSLTEICDTAFKNCIALPAVPEGKNITSIGSDAFTGCTALTEAVLPKKVTSIESGTFADCKALKSVKIPVGVKKIGKSAFKNCSALEEVYFAGTEEKWKEVTVDSDNDYLKLVEVTFGNEQEHEHSYTEKVTTPATCTTKGEMTLTCECGDTQTKEIPENGHTKVSAENAVEAKCLTEGKESDIKCSVCGIILEKGKVLPAKGHTEISANNAVSATCVTAGKTSDTKCSVCGVVITAGTPVPAAGHSYDGGVVTVEPTSQKEGVRTYTCTVCGDTKQRLWRSSRRSFPKRRSPSRQNRRTRQALR